jgi:nucleoside-diphosphate-sugar epimerase
MNLVTGGTGMVGMHLIAGLLRRGARVRAIIRSGSSHAATDRFLRHSGFDPAAVEWVEGDVIDLGTLEDALDGCETVFHAAALVSFHCRDRRLMYQTNVEGTANVVNLALDGGVQRLVYISSVAALGRNTKGIPVTEDDEWKDGPELSHYSRSKHLAEREVWRGREEGLEVVVVNPSVILGVGDFGRSSTELFAKVAQGLPVYPQGSNGFVAAEDVAAACFHLMDNGLTNERYLLNGGHLPLRELFTKMATELGTKPPRIELRPWMLTLGWLGASLVSLFTGKRAFITRENIRNAGLHNRYETARMEKTGFSFTPLDRVISQTSAYLKTYGDKA